MFWQFRTTAEVPECGVWLVGLALTVEFQQILVARLQGELLAVDDSLLESLALDGHFCGYAEANDGREGVCDGVSRSAGGELQ